MSFNEKSTPSGEPNVLVMANGLENEVSPEAFADSVLDDSSSNRNEELKALARSYTNLSQHTSASTSALGPIPTNVNPFNSDNLDPRLDPYSDKFSGKVWAQHMLKQRQRNPDSYPIRTAGVAFKDLGAYGYGKGTDYQKNVLNVVTGMFSKLANITNKGTKIQILRDFNGVVKSGETCVVLGRPGRYVYWPQKSFKLFGEH